MSDLQRSFLKSKLSKLPPVPAFSEADEEDEPSELASTNANASTSTSSAPSIATSQRARRRPADDYSPRSAAGYFEEALEVDVALSVGNASFRTYYTPPRPRRSQPPTRTAFRPSLAAPASLHSLDVNIDTPALPSLKPGIGLASNDADADDDDPPQQAPPNPGTLFVFHHGAGFSALSYALTAAEIIKATGGEVGVLAFDCRGHGRTRLQGVKTDPVDMSIDTLSSDLVALLSTMFPRPEDMPSLVLVGHSMGGSVVVSAAHGLSAKGFNRISGVAVLDVVEGTAMDALSVMRSVVLAHPSGFASVEDAIRWHVDSKTIANLDSARVSVPPLIEPNPLFDTNAPLADDEQQEILDDPTAPFPVDPQTHAYRWKADLLATEPYWPSWFRGLSSRFLSVKTARLLLLAGTDRLDRELMIGQMQGKYQLEVIADVGHSLHEDAPEKTARILVDFWRRNERINLPLKGVKKVGES